MSIIQITSLFLHNIPVMSFHLLLLLFVPFVFTPHGWRSCAALQDGTVGPAGRGAKRFDRGSKVEKEGGMGAGRRGGRGGEEAKRVLNPPPLHSAVRKQKEKH